MLQENKNEIINYLLNNNTNSNNRQFPVLHEGIPLFLFEFYIFEMVFPKDVFALLKQPVLIFRLFDFPSQSIHGTKQEKSSKVVFNSGKSCFFEMEIEHFKSIIAEEPLYIMLVDANHGDIKIIASSKLNISVFAYDQFCQYSGKPPLPRRNVLKLFDNQMNTVCEFDISLIIRREYFKYNAEKEGNLVKNDNNILSNNDLNNLANDDNDDNNNETFVNQNTNNPNNNNVNFKNFNSVVISNQKSSNVVSSNNLNANINIHNKNEVNSNLRQTKEIAVGTENRNTNSNTNSNSNNKTKISSNTQIINKNYVNNSNSNNNVKLNSTGFQKIIDPCSKDYTKDLRELLAGDLNPPPLYYHNIKKNNIKAVEKREFELKTKQIQEENLKNINVTVKIEKNEEENLNHELNKKIEENYNNNNEINSNSNNNRVNNSKERKFDDFLAKKTQEMKISSYKYYQIPDNNNNNNNTEKIVSYYHTNTNFKSPDDFDYLKVTNYENIEKLWNEKMRKQISKYLINSTEALFSINNTNTNNNNDKNILNNNNKVSNNKHNNNDILNSNISVIQLKNSDIFKSSEFYIPSQKTQGNNMFDYNFNNNNRYFSKPSVDDNDDFEALLNTPDNKNKNKVVSLQHNLDTRESGDMSSFSNKYKHPFVTEKGKSKHNHNYKEKSTKENTSNKNVKNNNFNNNKYNNNHNAKHNSSTHEYRISEKSESKNRESNITENIHIEEEDTYRKNKSNQSNQAHTKSNNSSHIEYGGFDDESKKSNKERLPGLTIDTQISNSKYLKSKKEKEKDSNKKHSVTYGTYGNLNESEIPEDLIQSSKHNISKNKNYSSKNDNNNTNNNYYNVSVTNKRSSILSNNEISESIDMNLIEGNSNYKTNDYDKEAISDDIGYRKSTKSGNNNYNNYNNNNNSKYMKNSSLRKTSESIYEEYDFDKKTNKNESTIREELSSNNNEEYGEFDEDIVHHEMTARDNYSDKQRSNFISSSQNNNNNNPNNTNNKNNNRNVKNLNDTDDIQEAIFDEEI